MKLKAKLRSIANRGLKPFGLELIRRSPNRIEMDAALHRVAQHGFPIGTVVDIGAAKGTWSVMALRALPQAKVLGIEPLKEREKDLLKLKKENLRFDFDLCVAGEKDGETAKLNVSVDHLGGSTVEGVGGESREVPVRSLDGMLTEKQLPGPFLLKFDTHGYELPILKGAEKILEQTQVIVMECYNFRFVPQALLFQEMCEHMDNLGFRPYDIANPSLRKHDRALWQIDLFFARKDHLLFSVDSYE